MPGVHWNFYYPLFVSICYSTIDIVITARINFNTISQHPDMMIVESEESPEVSREDLVRMIQKSQFFQDIFSEQSDPMMIQYGHVCENPTEWEQRFEKRDFNKNHYQGKMRWGNKNGDYGEHYWDLGHAG